MTGFVARVWAPLATRVGVVIVEGGERELRVGPDGWWSDDRELPVGTRYGFRLDDSEDVLYDPRGRRLPDGVHGLSEVVDASAPQAAGWAGRGNENQSATPQSRVLRLGGGAGGTKSRRCRRAAEWRGGWPRGGGGRGRQCPRGGCA